MGRMLVFYYFQAELGEDIRHPNVFEVDTDESTELTLGDLLKRFPLHPTGDFHWRFRTNVQGRKDYVWVDVANHAEKVPLYGGNVFAKILRLNTLRYSNVVLLPKRAGVSRSAAVLKTPASTGPRSNPSAFATVHPGHKPNPKLKSKPSQKQKRNQKQKNTGSGPSTSHGLNQHRTGISSEQRAADRIKLRKQEERKAIQEKVEQKRKLEENEEKEQETRAVLAKSLGPKLTQWSCPDGTPKNIRALLCTLHTVLWEGAEWKPVSVLVRPIDVKKAYRKALLLVHEDKLKGGTAEQKYIGQAVFESLNKQFTIFSQNEMKA